MNNDNIETTNIDEVVEPKIVKEVSATYTVDENGKHTFTIHKPE